MGDDAATRRAAALRKQVEELTAPGPEGTRPSGPPEGESPREFLHRRMAEERERERRAGDEQAPPDAET
jgi:hypothetical protein